MGTLINELKVIAWINSTGDVEHGESPYPLDADTIAERKNEEYSKKTGIPGVFFKAVTPNQLKELQLFGDNDMHVVMDTQDPDLHSKNFDADAALKAAVSVFLVGNRKTKSLEMKMADQMSFGGPN